jgi:hypothetical protein
MKERELRQHLTCHLCNQKIMASGLPLFWRVTVERFGLDLQAIQRQSGLEAMFNGNAFIAAAMGPDEDMATSMMEPVVLTVCETCGVNMDSRPVAFLAELGSKS